jgi:hypothetical protein
MRLFLRSALPGTVSCVFLCVCKTKHVRYEHFAFILGLLAQLQTSIVCSRLNINHTTKKASLP